MPKLRTILDNLDEVPEALRDSYVEKDDRFILDLDGIDDHPTVVNLKSAYEKVKRERTATNNENKTLKTKMEKFPEEFDPDEYLRLQTLVEEYEKDPDKRGKGGEEALAAKKILEQKIAAMEKKHSTEIETLNSQVSTKNGFINRLLIDDGLTKALIDAGVDKALLKAAKAMLRENCVVSEEDGEYKAMYKTSDVGEMEIAKFVGDWVASDEGKVFVTPAKGSGANGGSPKGKGSNEPNPWDKDHFNLTKQSELIASDRPRAERLAQAAGIALTP